MSSVLRRSAAILRRSGATRRFNTASNQAGSAASEGATPPPNGDWVRWINEFEKHCKHGWAHGGSASRHQPWGVHGPSLVFVGSRSRGGIVAPMLLGAGLWYALCYEKSDDKGDSLVRELQEETRELKLQVALIQQSIDHVKATQHVYPIYTPRQ